MKHRTNDGASLLPLFLLGGAALGGYAFGHYVEAVALGLLWLALVVAILFVDW